MQRVDGRHCTLIGDGVSGSCGSTGEWHHRSRAYCCALRSTGLLATVHILVAAVHLPATRHWAVRLGHGGEGRSRGHRQGQCKDKQGEQAPHVASVSASRLNRQLQQENLLESERCRPGIGRVKIVHLVETSIAHFDRSGTCSVSSLVAPRRRNVMDFDLVIIGTGTAAMVAAMRVRKADWTVAVVDEAVRRHLCASRLRSEEDAGGRSRRRRCAAADGAERNPWRGTHRLARAHPLQARLHGPDPGEARASLLRARHRHLPRQRALYRPEQPEDC